MKSKKFFSVLLAFSVVLALLAGCGSKSGSGDEASSSPSPSAANSASPSASASASASPSASAEDTSWADEKIDLKFASWEDEKVTNAMLDAFMKKYPNIHVTLDKEITWPFEQSLATAAAAGNMPDVFWMKDVPLAVQNDWLLDISQFWDNDPEAATVYPNTAAAMVYNGKRLASPTFEYPMGVFINKTLFEKNNIPLPSFNWTTNDMIDLAKKLSKPSDYYYGIGGAWGDLMFNEFFPMQYDKSQGYGTWDGEKFHYNNQLWIDAFNQKLDLIKLKAADVMTGPEKKKVFGDENAWTFQKGHVAMAIDGSWNLGWLIDDMKKSGAGDVDFWPYPGGTAGQRMPVILDFIGVSSTTKHARAAYELMKFMTWGKEGWLDRIDVMKSLSVPFDKFPLSNQPEIFEKLAPEYKTPGEQAIIQLLPEAVPGPAIPGQTDFQTWDGEQHFTEKLMSGEYKVADKAKEFEDKANEFVAAAMEKLKVTK